MNRIEVNLQTGVTSVVELTPEEVDAALKSTAIEQAELAIRTKQDRVVTKRQAALEAVFVDAAKEVDAPQEIKDYLQEKPKEGATQAALTA